MSTLIPTMKLSDFLRLNSKRIRRLKSVELTVEGEYLCTVIIPPEGGGMTIQDDIKTSAEYLAVRSNTAGGLDPEKIDELVEA